MNTTKTSLFLFFILIAFNAFSQNTLKLKDNELMHEMRATPSPLNNAVVSDRNPSFQWPLPADYNVISNPLDGFEEEVKHPKLDVNKANYKIRYSKNKSFDKNTTLVETPWPFYNPDEVLSEGDWYWQYAYVDGDASTWSEVLHFEVKENANKFLPPNYKTIVKNIPLIHPRILVFENGWNHFIEKNTTAVERSWYLEKAVEVLNTAIIPITTAIDTSKVAALDTAVKRNALLTRESRRIVDREEANIEILIRSYVLTKDQKYSDAALKRLMEVISWKQTPYLVGDFNQATLLSLSSLAYDSFYSILSNTQKEILLNEIKENGTKIFNGFTNHLENHIADNHNWQMNLRIFTMAAFSVYGDLPEADMWTDYAYNIWLARFPGLNKDGGWHNGDSYFHVNIRTLIEVPYLYSKISGYDFFKDPWYDGSAMYAIFTQPPFSKSSGNGSSHQNVLQPSGPRLAYADALAKLTGNTYLADYARIISESNPQLMKKGFMAKPGDLSWFRMQCDKELPKGTGLSDLQLSYIFPATGIASFMSSWKNLKRNSMFSFRSSPYGSTSHALANQNAYNTFYGGKPLFYSSGHHISFTDEHSVYCHRATRAHNSILVNGMGQKIGVEGYGWIPRYYSSEKLGYLVGDASNAYGEIDSPLWLKRGEQSGLEYSPKNGWDKNHLTKFRRHIVQLGGADLMFVYDELEADSAVTYSYLLHAIENPMNVKTENEFVHIQATNAKGVSDAYLFSADKLVTEATDKFFIPAINWLRADDKGNFPPYKSHWHFKATSPSRKVYRFATVINTRNVSDVALIPKRVGKNKIIVGDWIIEVNLSTKGKATFKVTNAKENVSVVYDDTTTIKENGVTTTLKDELPELEI